LAEKARFPATLSNDAKKRTGACFAPGLNCQIQAQNGNPGRIQLVQPPDLAIRREQLFPPPTRDYGTNTQVI